MKKILCLIILAYGITTISFGQEYTKEELKSKAFALEIAKKYYPSVYEIISETEANEVAKWMNNEGDNINASNFALAVHECVHEYDAKITVDEGYNWDTKAWNEGYFIDKGIKIVTVRFPVFKTSDLHSNYLPKEVKKLSRYNTYIHSPEGISSASTNVYGIFGLLEEFNAYYHGIRAKFELLNNDEKSLEVDTKAQESVKDDHVASYYEFNIFMAYYLKYAKEKKPEIFKKIMSSKELRLTYTLLEANWRNLLTDIYSNKKVANNFPCYEGEDELFTNELKQIMNSFKLSDEEVSEQNREFLSAKRYDSEIIKKNRSYCNNDLHFKEEDIDGNSENATMITVKEDDYHYLVVNSINQHGRAIMEYLKKYDDEDEFPNAGLYLGRDLSYHIYLARFKDKSEAQSKANTLRLQYADIKVL